MKKKKFNYHLMSNKISLDEKAVFMLPTFHMLKFPPKLSRGLRIVFLGESLRQSAGSEPRWCSSSVYLAVPNTSVFKDINIVDSALMNLTKKTYSHQSK